MAILPGPNLYAILVEKEEAIQQLQGELTARSYLLESLRKKVEAHQHTEQNLHAEIAERKRVEQYLNTELARSKQIEQCLAAELQELKRSTSYRLARRLCQWRHALAPATTRRDRFFRLGKRGLGVWRREGWFTFCSKAWRKIVRKSGQLLRRLMARLPMRWRAQGIAGQAGLAPIPQQSSEVILQLPAPVPSALAPEGNPASRPGRRQPPVLVAPTVQDIQLLTEILDRSPRRPAIGEKAIDIIIPVYKGLRETLRCLASLLTAATDTPHQIIVINDASLDPLLVSCLRRIASHGLIQLLDNPSNLGFVKTVNRGLGLNPDHDVILLNADTEVHGDWIGRLRAAAYSAPNVGTVTPLSNNATICSYPVFCQDNAIPSDVTSAQLDELCAQQNAGRYVEVPTGVGFCMYVRRDCLNAVGPLDEEHFGKGYGEENDFCMRAQRHGWRHLLATDTFVRHVGGVAFGDAKNPAIERALQVLGVLHPDYDPLVASHIRANPAHSLRRRLDLARLAGPQPAMLYVTHNLVGGTLRHVLDMAARLEEEGFRAIILRPIDSDRVRLERLSVPNTPNLIFSVTQEYWTLREALCDLGIEHAHVHHTLGLPRLVLEMIRDLGLPYDWTIHDYFAICPRVALIDESGTYCGEPLPAKCNVCVEKNGTAFDGPRVEITQWREDYHYWLGAARKVIVPHQDVATRLAHYFPDIEFTVRPHIETLARSARPVAAKLTPGEPLRVAVIGMIGVHKGSAILLNCARDALARGLPIHFQVVGFTDRDDTFRELPNVSITGSYQEETVFDLLESLRCHCAFFPSVWPETYCYTLSIALLGKLFPITFDLGAPAQRLRAAGVGMILPLTTDGATINNALLGLVEQLSRDLPDSAEELVAYENLHGDYYGLVPAVQRQAA
jgi:GT2 family glycosyltransferase